MRPSRRSVRFAVRATRPWAARKVDHPRRREDCTVNSGILAAILAVLWLVLFIWLGIRTLRRGHWVMFIVGIFIPLFWIIGALIPRTR